MISSKNWKHRAFPYNPILLFKRTGYIPNNFKRSTMLIPFKPNVNARRTQRKKERIDRKVFQKFLIKEAVRRSVDVTKLQVFMGQSGNYDSYEAVENGFDLHIHLDNYIGGNHLFIGDFDKTTFGDFSGVTSKLLFQSYIDLGKSVAILTSNTQSKISPLDFLQIEGSISFFSIEDNIPKADLIVIEDKNNVYNDEKIAEILDNPDQKVMIVADPNEYDSGVFLTQNIFELIDKFIPFDVATVNIFYPNRSDNYTEISGDSIYSFTSGVRILEHDNLELLDSMFAEKYANRKRQVITFVNSKIYYKHLSIHNMNSNKTESKYSEITDGEKIFYFQDGEVAAAIHQDNERVAIEALPEVKVSIICGNIIGAK